VRLTKNDAAWSMAMQSRQWSYRRPAKNESLKLYRREEICLSKHDHITLDWTSINNVPTVRKRLLKMYI
jgi:hypothetical protein